MRFTVLFLAFSAVMACEGGFRGEVDAFLREYERAYQKLYHAAALADWDAQTRIVEGDAATPARAKRAKEELAAFVGSVPNIERLRGYLRDRSRLDPLRARQLEVMLYNAADAPQTIPEVVKQRIALETDQTQTLYGFGFKLRGRPATPNQLDEILRQSTNPAERLAAWEASKAVGPALKPGMGRLRDLRNATVQALDYSDYFAYQVSDYGMTTAEMLALNDTLLAQLRPLYRELHTWVRYELARRYRQPVPDLIPAHWLPNRWAQDWSDLVDVAGMDVDAALKPRTPEWIVRQAEAFYVSLGFDTVPGSFWKSSSVFPLPADASFKKNTHASAWHLDLDRDVRSLMSVEPNAYWYETAHHELGHVYYFMSYSRPEVPLVLRGGANRAYHEGIGSMIGLAASQRRFLAGRGLIAADAKVDSVRGLLKEALNYVVFIPFSAGTMTRFEHSLYAQNLPADRFNAAWWELVRTYQGVAPPSPRDERYADGLTKTHITDDPAQYYDYALSFALLFQLHDHIAHTLLSQDPHDTDYYGSRKTGDFLRAIMAPGASRPWREVLKETTGRALDARAIVEYFQPLYDWLVKENRGRMATV
ncbi:MAG: M2 family metallopeptidase [Gemmatimonadetes bacterium]|nr:M2 family metallopeptidase [Gemmatimonadota bacterium]